MSLYYKLDGRTPVPCDAKEWALGLMSSNRMIKQEEVGECMISTVFLGLDTNHTGKGPPLLFETMIFGPVFDQCQWRYPTYMQAEEMHQRVVATVQEHLQLAEEHTADFWTRLRNRLNGG